jgi:SAM-dependent methyltransferase
MTALAERLLEKYFGTQLHPYRIFENEVEHRLLPDHTLLDAGCGRGAPILRKFVGRAKTLIGVDVVDFHADIQGVELLNCDLGHMNVASGSVDLVMSRSVMEHVADPLRVYSEIHRVLRPGGHFIFLTPNLWDYASIIAKYVPNKWYPWIVARTEGRAPEDVFPVCYATNTRRAVSQWAARTGFEIVSFRYLGQYPGYFMFNGFLFLLATGYEKLISRFEALGFLRGWIFVVLRKPAGPTIDGRATATE